MKRLFSAGGIVYKFENGQLKVLLISTKVKSSSRTKSEKPKRQNIWSLPKGLVEKGENPKETALREIKEETGVEGEIIDEVGEISYWFLMEGEKNFKTVKYFLVEYIAGEINPDWEVDAAKWFSPEDALKKLTYKTDRDILKKALEKIYEENIKQK